MKVGICTFYYGTYNYGANLQAYALWTLCRRNGFDAEQISYYDSSRIKRILTPLYRRCIEKNIHANLSKRKKAISEFRDSIAHSKLYYRNTLKKANEIYDVYIVGSDQVWNPSWINRFYSLSFADSNKRKMAYAASLGREEFTEENKKAYSEIINRMDVVSVREKQSAEMLSELTGKRIEWVLDPTMLLERDDWDKIASKRMIEERYVFCYFLKGDAKHRKLAEEYAKEHNLAIVTLPFLSYRYRKCDDGFGDYLLYDVSPTDFISLIKYSDFVFTDSFHATVFSHLYQKEFVVFSTEGKQDKVRMESLTDLFETSERNFVGSEGVTLRKIDGLKKIDYACNCDQFEELKQKSLAFLFKGITRWEQG